jgi:putative component of membrane protein insertase Oxa1/YidC/SpoIIIJ protein YidD
MQKAHWRNRRAFPWRIVVVAILVTAAGLDLTRDPQQQVGVEVATAGIGAYRRFASPVLESIGVTCRFELTCSRYADAVIRRFGLARGSLMALGRVARCGPWTPAGTIDPPPGS